MILEYEYTLRLYAFIYLLLSALHLQLTPAVSIIIHEEFSDALIR